MPPRSTKTLWSAQYIRCSIASGVGLCIPKRAPLKQLSSLQWFCLPAGSQSSCQHHISLHDYNGLKNSQWRYYRDFYIDVTLIFVCVLHFVPLLLNELHSIEWQTCFLCAQIHPSLPAASLLQFLQALFNPFSRSHSTHKWMFVWIYTVLVNTEKSFLWGGLQGEVESSRGTFS